MKDNDEMFCYAIAQFGQEVRNHLEGEQMVRVEFTITTVDLSTGEEKVRNMLTENSTGMKMTGKKTKFKESTTK